MQINSKRLRIEQAKLDDAPFYYELLTSQGWLKHIGDRGIKTRQDAEAYVQNSLLDSYANLGFGLYQINLKETGQAIGICGFLKRDYLDSPDLGYALLPEYEGQGYMQEAIQVCLDYAKHELGFKQVMAVTSLGNTRSRDLLLRTGFRLIDSLQPQEGNEVLDMYAIRL